MKKRWMLLTGIIFMCFSMTACLGTTNNKSESTPVQTEDITVGESEDPVSTADNGDAEKEEAFKVQGVYVGQIDANSIEVIVDKEAAIEEAGKPTAFRLSDAVRRYFDTESSDYKDFKEGATFEFKFVRNELGQKIIQSLSIP